VWNGQMCYLKWDGGSSVQNISSLLFNETGRSSIYQSKNLINNKKGISNLHHNFLYNKYFLS
jgi:hypothetical protein